MFRNTICLMLVLTPAASLQALEPPKVADPKDQQLVQAFLKNVANVPALTSPAICRKTAADEPESYCWILLRYADMPLTAYELTGDANHLETFVKCFENMRACLTAGTDGFLGWYGKALPNFRDPNDPDKRVDVMLSDFLATQEVCRFLELAGQDPVLAAKYAPQRREYLDLVENHFVKKWDVRGNYVDLGATGAIYRTNMALKDDKGNLTQPNNKHRIITEALLALYRVTGKDEYMKKAVKLGTRFKHLLWFKDGHYRWDYWDPAGAWDALPSDKTKWKHWIGGENSEYYGITLPFAVILYDHGIVFDKTDIDRFLKTQMTVCWNGDANDPKFHNVDGGAADGVFVSDALAPFEPKIADFLYTGPRQDERLKNAASGWQGGPVLNGWLVEKLLELPKAVGGKQTHLDAGQKFLQSKENQDFVNSLKFEVTGIGYLPADIPPHMVPMPTAKDPYVSVAR